MTEHTLVIAADVFQSLPPLYQAAARLLEDKGKARIEREKPVRVTV